MVDWHNDMAEQPIGHGRKLLDGDDVAVLSLGTIGTNVREACESLRNQGINVAHYDMIYLKPIDEDILSEVSHHRWLGQCRCRVVHRSWYQRATGAHGC